jgi:hypothetical protein
VRRKKTAAAKKASGEDGSFGLKGLFKEPKAAKKSPKKKRVSLPKEVSVVTPPVRSESSADTSETNPRLKSAWKKLGAYEETSEKKPRLKSAWKKLGGGGGKKELSPWMIHLKNFYEGKKEQDPEYKYSQAMKDAKDTYNK